MQEIFRLKSFNSTLVQLKEYEVYLLYRIKASFNSTLVQLKAIRCIIFNVKYKSFNSTLVQLKAEKMLELQYKDGSFNSTLVQLKVSFYLFVFKVGRMFQFYLSSIKSQLRNKG